MMVINSKAHKYPIYGGKNILRPMMKIYDGNSKMPIDVWSMVVKTEMPTDVWSMVVKTNQGP